MKEIKLNFKEHDRTIFVPLSLAVIFIFVEIWKFPEIFSDPLYCIIVNAFNFIVFFSFALYLYLEYLYYNYGLSVFIDDTEISIKDKRTIKKYKLNQITQFIKICSNAEAKNTIKFSTADYFFFYKIVFDDNTVVYISSLMTRNLNIFNREPEVTRSFIASIFLDKSKNSTFSKINAQLEDIP